MIEVLDKGLPYFTVVSLALTPATLLASVYVVLLWRRSALKALAAKEKTSVHWLILGVAVGFVGAVFDNAYWGFAWSAEHYSHQSTEYWFKYGVYSNAPFRQGLSLLAAFCHIRSAYVSENKHFKIFLASCWLVTIAAFVALIYI